MRDPARINRILERLKEHWHKHPDQRFWQILFNANRYLYGEETMMIRDPYYIEDDEFEKVMEEYYGQVDR